MDTMVLYLKKKHNLSCVTCLINMVELVRSIWIEEKSGGKRRKDERGSFSDKGAKVMRKLSFYKRALVKTCMLFNFAHGN